MIKKAGVIIMGSAHNMHIQHAYYALNKKMKPFRMAMRFSTPALKLFTAVMLSSHIAAIDTFFI